MKANRRKLIGGTLAMSAVLAASGGMAHAQEKGFPDRMVRIVVPYPPGGFNDTLGRLVAARLAEMWKQSVVVENKPGAGTMIGTTQVARAPADGYTLLVNQFPFAANPFLYKKMNYDTKADFAPVVLAGRSPMLTDLAGGQIPVAFDAFPHVLPFIQTGKIRPIAIANDKRSTLMPDLPTISESGVQGYEVSSWHGFMVPAGTPQDIVQKLNRDINAVLEEEAVKKTFREQGVVPDGGSSEAFGRFIDQQMALWERVVKDAGIHAE